MFLKWCAGQDLNLHGFRHTPLKRTCLPIPPPAPQAACDTDKLYGKPGASKLRFLHYVRPFQVVEDQAYEGRR